MVALGPAVGFLMGSLFLSKWINIGEYIDNDYIKKTDPQWIGRWWAGFLLSLSILLVLSFIIFTFPSQLEQHENNQINESNEILPSNQSLFQLSTIKGLIINLFLFLKYINFIS